MTEDKDKAGAHEAADKKRTVSEEAAALPPAKRKRRYGRAALIAGEGLAVLLLIVSVVAAFGVWRLKSGPVDISFANDYVESALRNDESGVYATLDKSALYWPDLSGPLLLGLQGGRITKGQSEIASVDEVALSLSKAKLLIGQIEPLSLIITRPVIRVIRKEDDTLDFGLGTQEEAAGEAIEAHAEERRDLIHGLLDIIEGKDGQANAPSAMSSLKTLQIVDAQVMVEDHKIGASWFFPGFNMVFEKAVYGLSAKLDVEFPEVRGEKSYFHSRLLLNRDAGIAEAITNVKNLDLRIFAGKVEGLDILGEQDVVLDANVVAKLDKNFALQSLRGELLSAHGGIFSESLSAIPVPYENMRLLVNYVNDEQGAETLDIPNLHVTAKGVTFRGQVQMANMRGESGENAGYGGKVALMIDDMPHSLLAPLWPVALIGDSSEEWIVKKMGGGDLKNLKAEAMLALFRDEAGVWQADIQDLLARFAFVDMDMDYRAPLPPLQKATGSGLFDLEKDTLGIRIERGQMGGLDISRATVGFGRVAGEGDGHIALDIDVQGPLDKVFAYISEEPISLEEELDTDITKVKGAADLKVKLDFPTRDDLAIEEINMDINGTITEGYMPDVLEGLPLSGGPFAVSLNNERYTVSGSGALDGRPVTFEWLEYIDSKDKDYKHRAKANISVDPALRAHFGVDLDDFIEGSAIADLVYTGYSSGKADLDLEVDATPARFFIKPFQYEKPAGEKASARLKVHLQDNNLKSISALNGEAPYFKLENAAIDFRGAGKQTEIAKAVLERLVVGETVARTTIDISPQGVMKIGMNGPFLDLRPFMDNEGQGAQNTPDAKAAVYENPPMVLAVAVDQMRTDDEETVQYAKIFAEIDDQGRFSRLELDAIAGAGDIYLRYKPNVQGVRTFRLEAEDAGAALKAFGVYDSIRGGKLDIYAEPIRAVYDRNLIGVAQITNFRVVNAPAIARLVGALSLPGVMQTLNGEGLVFTKLEANFDWLYRKRGALLVLKDGRTSGNSLGLTFDGTFDNAAHTVDVHGTIIPLSGLNKAIGSIPLLGDIITGGTGALFAATYSMEGNSEQPDISVNPLSVLTPGILRRILFEQ